MLGPQTCGEASANLNLFGALAHLGADVARGAPVWEPRATPEPRLLRCPFRHPNTGGAWLRRALGRDPGRGQHMTTRGRTAHDHTCNLCGCPRLALFRLPWPGAEGSVPRSISQPWRKGGCLLLALRLYLRLGSNGLARGLGRGSMTAVSAGAARALMSHLAFLVGFG